MRFHWSRITRRLRLRCDRQMLLEHGVLDDGRKPAICAARTSIMIRLADRAHRVIAFASATALARLRAALRAQSGRPARALDAAAVAMAQPARRSPASALSRFDAWLGTCGFDGCPTPRRDPRLPPERGRTTSSTGTASFIGHLAIVRRVNVPLDAVPEARARTRSSPPRTAASTSTTASTGAASSAPSLRNVSAGGVREGFSTITMQVAHNSFLARALSRPLAAPQARRAAPLAPARARAHEGPDPRALPQRHLPRQRRERRRGGEPRSVRQERQQAHARRRRDARRAAQGAVAPTRRARNPQRAVQRRNLVLALMAEQGYITPRRRRPPTANAARASPRTSGVRRSPTSQSRSTPCARSSTRCCPTCSRKATSPSTRRSTARSSARPTAPCFATSPPITRETQRVVRPRDRSRAGRARRARSAQRRHPRARRRASARSAAVQSRLQGAAPARLGVQAVRLRGGARGGYDARRRSSTTSRSKSRRGATSGGRRTTTTSYIGTHHARAGARCSRRTRRRCASARRVGDAERDRGGATQRHHESADPAIRPSRSAPWT